MCASRLRRTLHVAGGGYQSMAQCPDKVRMHSCWQSYVWAMPRHVAPFAALGSAAPSALLCQPSALLCQPLGDPPAHLINPRRLLGPWPVSRRNSSPHACSAKGHGTCRLLRRMAATSVLHWQQKYQEVFNRADRHGAALVGIGVYDCGVLLMPSWQAQCPQEV